VDRPLVIAEPEVHREVLRSLGYADFACVGRVDALACMIAKPPVTSR